MQRCLSFVVVAIACFLAADSAEAQKAAIPNSKFVVEPDKVLAFDTATSPTGPYEFRPAPGADPITRTIVAPTNIKSMSLHIRLENSLRSSAWKLRIKDLSGTERDLIEADSPRSQLQEMWTEDVPGNGVIVELSASHAPGDLRIVIDRYSYPIEPSVPQAIWGDDQRQSINSVSQGIRKVGMSVARLRIKKSTGEALCTGFLVSDDLLITNYHCISSRAEALATRADFGFDDTSSHFKTFNGNVLELVNSEEAYDYVLIRLSGTPGKTFGHIRLALPGASTVKLPHDLIIVEHAGGGPKQVSIVDCQEVVSPITGIDARRKTDFAHHCDTLGGSSGSPVLDYASKDLLGLHHLGFNKKDPKRLINQAVDISYVMQDIKLQSPADYQEIVAANSSDPVAGNHDLK